MCEYRDHFFEADGRGHYCDIADDDDKTENRKQNYSPVYPPRSGIALPEEGNRPDRAVLRLDEVRHPAEGVVLVDVVAGAVVVVAVAVFRCNNAAVVRR